jgi:transglutaminase-like putative cysteine protease
MKFWTNGILIDNIEAHFSEDYYLLDDNNYVQWLLFFKTLAQNQPADRVNILIPQERMNVKAQILSEGGKDQRYFHKTVIIQNQVAKAFISQKEATLHKLEIPEQNIVVQKSGSSAEDQRSRLDTTDSFLFPVTLENDAEWLAALKIKIKTRVYGKKVTAADLVSSRQSFQGELRDNTIDGVLEITPVEYTGQAAPSLPFSAEQHNDPAPYLKPEIGIEADDPAIVKAAAAITTDAADAWEAAVRIVSEVYKKIAYDVMTQGSAKSTLMVAKGDAGEKAKLAVALCRAAGIPARLAGGLVYVPLRGGAFTPFVWIEVYMGKAAGWVPLDPTMGQYGRVDATHIKLWSEGILASLQIEVLEEVAEKAFYFSPRVPLQQPQKQMRYRFVVGDTPIGTLRATVTKARLKSRAAFLVKSQLQLDSKRVNISHTLAARSKLYIDAYGLPVRYDYSADLSGSTTAIRCRFESDRVITEMERDGEQFSGEFNFRQNTYCLDKDMIEQWAVMMRSLPLSIGKRIYVMGFVPQRKAQLAVRIDVIARQKVVVGKKILTCYVCELFPLGETFYVSTAGDLVRVRNEAQKLSIEWIPE